MSPWHNLVPWLRRQSFYWWYFIITLDHYISIHIITDKLLPCPIKMLHLILKCGPDSGAYLSTTLSHRVGLIQQHLTPAETAQCLYLNLFDHSPMHIFYYFLFILFRFFFSVLNCRLLFSSDTNRQNSQGQICSLFHLIFVSYFLICDNTTWSGFEMRHLLKAVRLSFHMIHISLTCQSRSYYFEIDPWKQEL